MTWIITWLITWLTTWLTNRSAPGSLRLCATASSMFNSYYDHSGHTPASDSAPSCQNSSWGVCESHQIGISRLHPSWWVWSAGVIDRFDWLVWLMWLITWLTTWLTYESAPGSLRLCTTACSTCSITLTFCLFRCTQMCRDQTAAAKNQLIPGIRKGNNLKTHEFITNEEESQWVDSGILACVYQSVYMYIKILQKIPSKIPRSRISNRLNIPFITYIKSHANLQILCRIASL